MQKPKETEEALTDELQLLTHMVISKHALFHQNLDATLKQQYVNQLYDHNNVSVAKALLIQMPKVTFTQFKNELAWVLETCQCKDKVKSVSVSQVDAKSEETEPVSKSQCKHEAKISAQSSQIWDLHT